MGELMLIK